MTFLPTGTSVNVKYPSRSVITPLEILAPKSSTLAPISGSSDCLSRILPLIVPFCPYIIEANNVKIMQIDFFIVIGLIFISAKKHSFKPQTR
jgi:hypothetical protein